MLNPSLDDLKTKGLVEVSTGVFKHAYNLTNDLLKTLEEKVGGRIVHVHLKKGRSSKDEEIFVDTWKQWKQGIVIVLVGREGGLNHGLMNKHWTVIAKEKKAMIERVKKLNARCVNGQVMLTYVRYSAKLMDWDNLCSTMKLPLDAIVQNAIIKDDSPTVITKFIPEQRQCRRKDARMEFYFEPI